MIAYYNISTLHIEYNILLCFFNAIDNTSSFKLFIIRIQI